MERIINLRMLESDAKLLMQFCNMSIESAIEDRFRSISTEYRTKGAEKAFYKEFEGFTPEKMSRLCGDIFNKLDEVFCPVDEIEVNLFEEENTNA